MKTQIFTIEQLESIETTIKSFLNYVQEHDKKSLPQCFDFCRLIVKNIDICKNDNYADINSLSKYIIQDWKSATSPRIGLQEYYISNDSFETQKEINNQINQFIQTINQYINI